MIVTGLKHYTIRASAQVIDQCIAFYTSILNLRIGFRPPLETSGFWLYAGDQPVLHVLIYDEPEFHGPSVLGSIAFGCVNLPVTIQRLEDLEIDYTKNYLADIDQFQIFVADPAGLTIELNFDCEKIDTTDQSGT